MDSERLFALLTAAQRSLQQGEPAEALRQLQTVSPDELEPELLVEWAAVKAWALIELDRSDEAIDMLESLLESQPESARLHAAHGMVLGATGEIGGAVESLETALELAPNDPDVLLNLAQAYQRSGSYERAEALLHRVLELGIDLTIVLPRIAALKAEMGQTSEACKTLRRYLSVNPDDAEEWVNLGILLSDDDEFDDALSCYRAAEQIEPDSIGLRLNWGVTAVRAGKPDIARIQLAYLKRIDPDSSRPLLLEAFISEQEGEEDQAARLHERALEALSPGDHSEAAYAYEMVMDFYARRRMVRRCQKLLAQAYEANACTIEVCELFREITGQAVRKASWFSVVVEANYRPGLSEVPQRGPSRRQSGPYTRFLRNVQLVARDRDEAVAGALQFVKQMGESGVQIREILQEEPVEDTFTGIYEVEEKALVFNENEDEPG